MKKGKRRFPTMEVIRVTLNPEQAVLSCCDSGGRLEVTGGEFVQCNAGFCGTLENDPSS